MTIKREARLTSSLLARKGNAQPFSAVDIFSLPPQAAVTQNAGSDERATGGRPQRSWPPSPANLSTKDGLSENDKSKNASSVHQPTPRKVSANGAAKPGFNGAGQSSSAERRVALTLRVDQERHMRLKLLSAKTRRSSQEVLLAALDAFLEHASEEMEFCECLRPASMCKGTKELGPNRER